MSNESTAVILKSSDDWDAWNKQFKAEAKREKLLDQIEGTASYRTMPQELDLRRFLPQDQRPQTR